MNSFLEMLRGLGGGRLMAMGGMAAGLVGFFIFIAVQVGSPPMALLYGGLDLEDSAEMVATLEGVGIPFEIRGNGTQILVPVVQGFLPDPVDIDPATIVRNSQNNVAALVERVQGNRPQLGLARGNPLGGAFQAVITGIADHVHERILNQLQHLAVQFGIRADHFQFDLFAEIVSQIANDPGQLRPGVSDRLHSCFHHPFLKVGGDVAEAL